eukprot:6477124-Amphidinium_carterae.1
MGSPGTSPEDLPFPFCVPLLLGGSEAPERRFEWVWGFLVPNDKGTTKNGCLSPCGAAEAEYSLFSE